MQKKLLKLGLAIVIFWVGYALFMHVSKQVITPIVDDVLARSYLVESHTPSIAEIEALTRMQLPQGYRALKALSHVEPREPTQDFMRVKLLAERSEIKKALSAAGLYGNLQPNPEERSIDNGEIKISWWDPDSEQNVLSGYYAIDDSSASQRPDRVWTIRILIAQHEKELDTLYVEVFRH